MVPVIAATMLATPVYEARTRLLIEMDNPEVVNFKPVIPKEQIATDYYQTQYELLQSRTLARKTLDKLDLWNHPEFGGGTTSRPGGIQPDRWEWLRSTWFASFFSGQRENARSTPPASSTEDFAPGSPQVDAFLAHLIVGPVRNTRLVDLYFRSTDPVLAARVANALAQSYIEHSLELRMLTTQEASKWLSEQLAAQRKEVEASEAALQAYRERDDALSLEESQNIVVQKLAELNSAVTRVKAERIEKESLYDQLRTLQRDRKGVDTFPAILSNGFIQELKAELAGLQRQRAELSAQYGDRHPEMVKLETAIQNTDTKLQSEIQKIVDSVVTEYRAVAAQEASLSSALEQQKREAQDLNEKAIGYGTLQRNAKSNRDVFESLPQRANETNVFNDLNTSNIRVVDAAEVPSAPVSPRKKFNLLLALMVGTMLAGVMVVGREVLDNRITAPDDIKPYLEVPLLGWVPLLGRRAFSRQAPLINGDVPFEFAEAFRMARSNLRFYLEAEPRQIVVVTSTGSSEGKTVVAANLAIASAQSGQRVLLIDADLRRPGLHRFFQEPRTPGLCDVIRDTSGLTDAVRQSDVPNLWLLAAGAHEEHPAECLESDRFQDLLTHLRDSSDFDRIIIDTPPVLPVADACIVAHAASAVVFVVGSELTSRDAARAALEQLSTAAPKFLGVLLNRVNVNRSLSSDWTRYRYRGGYADRPAVAGTRLT
jgi:capsular exopolysaccharide synthesis family protein